MPQNHMKRKIWSRPPKTTTTFHLSREVGPFIFEIRFAFDDADKILAGIHLPKESKWRYDTHDIIFHMSKDNGREAHRHEPNPPSQPTELSH